MKTRCAASDAAIANYLANGGKVTRIERGQRTVANADMKLAVRGDIKLG